MRSRQKFYILLLLTVAAIAGVLAMPPIPQSASYHDFCGARPFAGIPNFGNVISNLPFVIVGFIGLSSITKSAAPGNIAVIYIFLFTGIALTGFGSAFYHLFPDNARLVFDRPPMTIVFMSLLAAIIAVVRDGEGIRAFRLSDLFGARFCQRPFAEASGGCNCYVVAG